MLNGGKGDHWLRIYSRDCDGIEQMKNKAKARRKAWNRYKHLRIKPDFLLETGLKKPEWKDFKKCEDPELAFNQAYSLWLQTKALKDL